MGRGTPKFKIEPNMLCGIQGFFFWSDGQIKLAHCKKLKLNLQGTSSHIVKEVVVVKLFPSIHQSCLPSIHPVIHPWMASYREENPGRNKYPPPLCACVTV